MIEPIDLWFNASQMMESGDFTVTPLDSIGSILNSLGSKHHPFITNNKSTHSVMSWFDKHLHLTRVWRVDRNWIDRCIRR